MPRSWALVATTFTPTRLGPRPWVDCPIPAWATGIPKGKMSADYGVWNEERGAPNRAVIVVDKQGIVRFRRIYEAGVLPDPDEILQVIQGLG